MKTEIKNEIKIEEYRGEHNKLYLTCPVKKGFGRLHLIAKKRFRYVPNKKIRIRLGYTVGNGLIFIEDGETLENKRGVWVAYIE